MIDRVCERCGGAFTTWKTNRGRFCSRECRYAASSEERFWTKVDKNGPVPEHRPELGACWVFTAHRNRKGYGWIWFEGELRQAHRVAFFLAHGRWPEPCALHHCDNPSCVRAEHLFEGTLEDNNKDMKAKGRSRGGAPTGVRNANAKLDADRVRELRASFGPGVTKASLARRYGICDTTVKKILTGRTWRGV